MLEVLLLKVKHKSHKEQNQVKVKVINSLQELALIHMIMDVNRKQLAINNEGSHSHTTTRRYTFT